MTRPELTMSARALPPEWSAVAGEAAKRLEDELSREVTTGHALHGAKVAAVAVCDASDDVLFQHSREDDHFTVVHLTWRGRAEDDARWPAVVFDGTFDEFFASI